MRASETWRNEGLLLLSPDAVVAVPVAVTLAYATYRDLKYRDIPELTWVPAALFVIIYNAYLGRYEPIHTLFSFLPAIALLAMAFLDLIGGADALAMLLIAVAHPSFLVLPISLLTMAFSVIPPMILIVYYLILNLSHKEELNRLACVRGSKKLLLFMGRPLRVRDYLRSKFLFLLTVPTEKGFQCGVSADIDIDFEQEKRIVIDALRKGVISEDSLVWVSPALPHIAFIFVGYVISLFIPQDLLLSLFLRTR